MQVYILTVTDKANFDATIHQSAWRKYAQAESHARGIVQAAEAEDRANGFNFPSYDVTIMPMRVQG